MKEFKGKPGPWHWEGKVLCNDDHIVGGDGWTFSDADKSLIAAAPELLEALKEMVGCIDYYAGLKESGQPNIEDWAYASNSAEIVKARLAISKALGEKQ